MTLNLEGAYMLSAFKDFARTYFTIFWNNPPNNSVFARVIRQIISSYKISMLLPESKTLGQKGVKQFEGASALS